MSWSRYVFSRDYKTIKIEGSEPERLLNSCLLNNIQIRRVKYITEKVVILQISSGDYFEMENTAGSRYRITVLREDGSMYRLRMLKKRKALLAGILIFVCLMFYQSLFVAEIEVNGYESINEQALIDSMEEAGFYEGCRKNVDLDKVKLHLYDDFELISWIGIKYRGNLAQVTIVETDNLYKKNKVVKTKPCNITADKSGYIHSVNPEEGLRAVNDGQYVREGDILITGVIPLEKTTYDEESQKETETYVHAAGTVEAKIPVRLNFYEPSSETVKTKTGKKVFTLSINDKEMPGIFCPYETAQITRFTLINWIRPVRFKLQVNMKEEVTVKEQKKTRKQLKKEVLNEINEYVKEKLPNNVQILNKSLNFSQEKNIINIGVTLETLQQIGIEEEIIVDKSNRKSEEDGDQ